MQKRASTHELSFFFILKLLLMYRCRAGKNGYEGTLHAEIVGRDDSIVANNIGEILLMLKAWAGGWTWQHELMGRRRTRLLILTCLLFLRLSSCYYYYCPL